MGYFQCGFYLLIYYVICGVEDMLMAFKILYVEDEEMNKALMREVFKSSSYQLIEAHDGQSGYDAALRSQPDLILMDIGLPDMEGTEVVLKLKQTPSVAHIPVIALTADSSREKKDRCLEVGCASILLKPISRFTLLETIRKYAEPQSVAPVPTQRVIDPEQPTRKKVLVVDDNEDLRLIFTRIFERLNFEVHSVSDGFKAIETLNQTQPDVVILDVNMPGLSGFDVLSHIRGDDQLHDTKVIMVTGDSMVSTDPMTRQADLVLLKPVDIHELMYFAKRLIVDPVV